MAVPCCGRRCKLCHKQTYLAVTMLPHVLKGPSACTPVQPGQQDAAHYAAHHPPALCLPCCTAHIQVQTPASQPAAPGMRAHRWCLQVCTAHVLVRSLANQARAGTMQHQTQLAVNLLKELHDKAEAGDWDLENAVKVGCIRFRAICGSTWCKGWLRGWHYQLGCRHWATCQGRQTGQAQELPAELLGS